MSSSIDMQNSRATRILGQLCLAGYKPLGRGMVEEAYLLILHDPLSLIKDGAA